MPELAFKSVDLLLQPLLLRVRRLFLLLFREVVPLACPLGTWRLFQQIVGEDL